MAAKYEIDTTADGQFVFRLKAGNGQIILQSEEYTSKSAAHGGIDSVKANASIDARYERGSSSGDQPFFVLKAANAQTIGRSQMYASASAMEQGIASVKANAPGAAVEDLT